MKTKTVKTPKTQRAPRTARKIEDGRWRMEDGHTAVVPDLLAALADLLAHVEIGEGHDANGFECVRAARAAIAKYTITP